MRFCIATLIALGLAFSAWTPTAEAQSVTRSQPVSSSNFSRTFVRPHYGGFSNPSNYGYFGMGSLNHSWNGGLSSSGESISQPLAASSYGLSGYSLNFTPSPINPGGGLLPVAPGGAVNAPEGAPTLTPGETIWAGSAFPSR